MEAVLQLKTPQEFGLKAPQELGGLGTSAAAGEPAIGGIAGNLVDLVLRSAAFHIDSHEDKASVD